MKRECLTKRAYCIIWPLKFAIPSASCDLHVVLLPNDWSTNGIPGGRVRREKGEKDMAQLQVDNRCWISPHKFLFPSTLLLRIPPALWLAIISSSTFLFLGDLSQLASLERRWDVKKMWETECVYVCVCVCDHDEWGEGITFFSPHPGCKFGQVECRQESHIWFRCKTLTHLSVISLLNNF